MYSRENVTLVWQSFFFHSSLIKIIHSNCSCLVVGKLQVNARWKYFHAYSQLIYRALHWAYDKLLLYFLFIFFFNAITRQWHDHFWSRIGQNRLKLLSWPKDQAEAVLGSFQLLLCETARRGLAFHISAFMIIVFFFFLTEWRAFTRWSLKQINPRNRALVNGSLADTLRHMKGIRTQSWPDTQTIPAEPHDKVDATLRRFTAAGIH